jgi:hypothetical protein
MNKKQERSFKMGNVSKNRFMVSIVALCLMFGTAGFAVDANDIIVNQGDLSVAGTVTADDVNILNPSDIYKLSHDSFTGFVAAEHLSLPDYAINVLTNGDFGPLDIVTGGDLDITSTNTTIDVVDVTANSLTTGAIFDFDHSTSSIAANKTGVIGSISSSRVAPSGTYSDNYDALSVVRAAMTGGGTLTSAGSVLFINNYTEQMSGTLTDTTHGIEMIMQGPGTGNAIDISVGAGTTSAIDADGNIAISADSKKLRLGATLTDLEIYSDGTDGIIDVTGKLGIGGNVDITGTVNTTSDDNWDLNDYTGDSDHVAAGYVTVTINGTSYRLLAYPTP